MLVVANTSGSHAFTGAVLCDVDINRTGKTFKVAYSNKGTIVTGHTAIAPGVLHAASSSTPSSQIASLPISLAPLEVQILSPAV